MKGKVVVILAGVASLHLIALGTIGLSGGCKSLFGSSEEKPEAAALPPVTSDAGTTAKPADYVPFTETQPSSLQYTVKSGDSLWKVAKMYGVTTESLANVNKISANSPLKTGMALTIPPGGKLVAGAAAKPDAKKSTHDTATVKKATAAIAASSTKKSSVETAEGGTYIVKEGDSLWKIAAKHNLKTEALAKANNLDPKKALKVGQKLVISKTGAPTATAASTTKKPDAKKDTAKKADAKATTKTAATAAAATPAETAPASKTEAKGKDALDSLNKGTETTDDLLEDIAGEKDDAKAAAPKKPASSHETVEITEETTIQSIASQYGVKVEDLKKVNQNLPSNGKLTPGMIIALP